MGMKAKWTWPWCVVFWDSVGFEHHGLQGLCAEFDADVFRQAFDAHGMGGVSRVEADNDVATVR